MELANVHELIDVTGSIKIYHNDKHTYIVYEQKIDKNEFISIKDGLYKFYFCAADLPMKKEFIPYDDFIKEIQENLMNEFQIYDEDDTLIESYYVKRLIETEKKNLYKYQIKFV